MKTSGLFFSYSKLIRISCILFLCCIRFGLHAQSSSPFVPAFQTVDKANLIMLGNVSVSCDITGAFPTNCTTCANMQNSLNPNFSCGNNANFVAVNIDVDNDPSTFMSSSDSLNLDQCNQILYAGLFFCQQSLTPADSVIKIKFNSGPYQNIQLSACITFTNTYGTASFSNIDITSMLSAAGPKARITLANLKTDLTTGSLGGWSVVVVYKDGTKPKRSVNIWNGVQQSNSVIPLSGFLTQPAGPVNFECGVVGWEGERNLGGDYFRFNGLNLGNGMNSTTNFFNATITNNGALTPFRLPNFNNTVGLDADIVVPNNSTYAYLGNSASTCTLSTVSVNDGFIPQVLTLVIDVYDPNINPAITINDINGGAIAAGDILQYKIKVNAVGDEASLNTIYHDTLDANLSFIPNSLKIISGPNAGFKTDIAGDDQLDYMAATRAMLLRVGTGANSIVGGIVTNSPLGADSTVFTYSVVVTPSCLKISCDSTLQIDAAVSGIGSVSTNSFVNNYFTVGLDQNACPIYTPNYSVPLQHCFLPNTANSSPVCSGNSITLNATTDMEAAYSWSGPLSYTSSTQTNTLTTSTTSMSGIYTVTMSIPSSTCSYVSSTTVTVNPSPTVSIVSLNTPTLCVGGTSTVTASGAATYTLTDGINNSTTVPFIVSPNTSTTYSVTGTNVFNCQGGLSFSITVYPLPQLTVTAIPLKCYQDSSGSVVIVTNPLTVAVSGGSLTNLAAGNYSYVITNTLTGCENSQSITVSQPAGPLEVNIASSVNTDCGKSTGSINTITTGGTPGYAYMWNTGYQTDGLSNLPEGTYTLIVSDVNNCSDTVAHSISCDGIVFIPEFFTPNGDGKNDQFEIIAISKYPNNTLQVFNRWGSLVYNKQHYNNEWDGKPNVSDATGDNILPTGVYFILFDFGDDQSTPYHGYVHVMR